MATIAENLQAIKEAVYGEDAMDAETEDDCDCNCDECDECAGSEDEELGFDCPHCGNPVMIKASDIDFDQSPLCPACGKPFFPDETEEEDGPDDGADQ